MSQFNIRSLREIHSDEQGKFINTLAKRVSTFLNKEQTDKLENKEDVYSAGQDVESVVKFHDMVSSKYFDFETEFYPPTEPDGDKVRVWLRGGNLGNELSDISGNERHGIINGDPQLVDGTPFDLGIHTGGVKSTALRFNRPTSESVNEEYISIDDSGPVRIGSSDPGFSIFVRFKIHSIAQQGGLSRTIFEKIDDDAHLDGYMLKVTDTGRLVFIVSWNGTEYKKQTATSTIAVDTVYEVWVNFTVVGTSIKIYINNVDKSLTDDGSSTGWHSTVTNHDISIFRRGQGSNGYVYGDLYDFLFYKHFIISTAEVGYHYTNKWTTADIPFGQVIVANYWATYTP